MKRKGKQKMNGYAKRKNGKVLSYCDIRTFYDFYFQTSMAHKIIKLDDTYYYLTDTGFKHVESDSIVIFDKNEDHWTKYNDVISKKEFDSEFAVIEAPWIPPFLMSFRFHMRFDQMITVFTTMLDEFNADDTDDTDNLKDQLEWILKNQEVFKYILG